MEIWKTIPNYEDYQASNLGRIKSLKFGKELVLKLKLNNTGYMQVSLTKNNIKKYFSVHRLVAFAFLGISDLDVDHINSNRQDNRIENLRYCNKRENSHFRYQKQITQSKYVGVTKHGKKWRTRISINGIQTRLGTYKTEIEAYQAYLNKLNTL